MISRMRGRCSTDSATTPGSTSTWSWSLMNDRYIISCIDRSDMESHREVVEIAWMRMIASGSLYGLIAPVQTSRGGRMSRASASRSGLEVAA